MYYTKHCVKCENNGCCELAEADTENDIKEFCEEYHKKPCKIKYSKETCVIIDSDELH